MDRANRDGARPRLKRNDSVTQLGQAVPTPCLVMAHREFVGSFYASNNPAMITERVLDYSRSFAANATREEIAQQILQDLGMDGAHSVSGGRDGKPVAIQREHALPQRLRATHV